MLLLINVTFATCWRKIKSTLTQECEDALIRVQTLLPCEVFYGKTRKLDGQLCPLP